MAVRFKRKPHLLWLKRVRIKNLFSIVTQKTGYPGWSGSPWRETMDRGIVTRILFHAVIIDAQTPRSCLQFSHSGIFLDHAVWYRGLRCPPDRAGFHDRAGERKFRCPGETKQMTTRDCPYYELQRQNPFRKPSWRWDRANDLVNRRRYYSKKRDDTATGIAVRI